MLSLLEDIFGKSVKIRLIKGKNCVGTSNMYCLNLLLQSSYYTVWNPPHTPFSNNVLSTISTSFLSDSSALHIHCYNPFPTCHILFQQSFCQMTFPAHCGSLLNFSSYKFNVGIFNTLFTLALRRPNLNIIRGVDEVAYHFNVTPSIDVRWRITWLCNLAASINHHQAKLEYIQRK